MTDTIDGGDIRNEAVIIPTEIYSRVVGYYRPVGQWNKGKQSEFGDRVTYEVNV